MLHSEGITKWRSRLETRRPLLALCRNRVERTTVALATCWLFLHRGCLRGRLHRGRLRARLHVTNLGRRGQGPMARLIAQLVARGAAGHAQRRRRLTRTTSCASSASNGPGALYCSIAGTRASAARARTASLSAQRTSAPRAAARFARSSMSLPTRLSARRSLLRSTSRVVAGYAKVHECKGGYP